LNACIEYMDFHAPARTITIRDVLGGCSLTEKELEKISLRLLGKIESKGLLIEYFGSMSSMFFGDRRREGEVYESMLERMFKSGIVRPEEISHVIYTHGDSISLGDPWSLDPDDECVNIPYFLQQRTGMNGAVVFNVEQECTGSFTALNIATLLVQQGEAKNILILSSNFFGMTPKRLMGGAVFIGDGQGLMLIGRGPGIFQIRDSVGFTDGRINSVNSFLDPDKQQRVVDVGAKIMQDLLHRNRLSVEDVSFVVPLNTSQFPWVKYTRSLGIPIKKVFLDNMGKGGHIGDVDLVRNLRDLGAKRDDHGGYVVAYGVSTGTSWNALLLRRTHGQAVEYAAHQTGASV
jgi:hypothetical protein